MGVGASPSLLRFGRVGKRVCGGRHRHVGSQLTAAWWLTVHVSTAGFVFGMFIRDAVSCDHACCSRLTLSRHTDRRGPTLTAPEHTSHRFPPTSSPPFHRESQQVFVEVEEAVADTLKHPEAWIPEEMSGQEYQTHGGFSPRGAAPLMHAPPAVFQVNGALSPIPGGEFCTR